MKTLYLPIHVGGTYRERSLANKHGLRDALAALGQVREIDYLSITPADLDAVLRTEIDSFQPELLFTQIQGVEPLTTGMLWKLRETYPTMKVVNWNGDYWPEHLTSPEMLDLLLNVDLQLVVNGSVLDAYQQHGIHAAFCPFGYETPLAPLDMNAPFYDVLFLGNNYSEKRQQLYETLRSLQGVTVGIYGAGWPVSQGECNYDFAAAESLYAHAQIVISDNQFPDAKGYMSDRPIQALAAGTLVLQQYVADLEGLAGLMDGVHYVQWKELSDLPGLIEYWLSRPQEHVRARIAREGQAFVKLAHTWDSRVRELMISWLPELGRVKA